MKAVNKGGFTIIESMLFLAITGLMVMAILLGSSSSINRQRYRDSVNTLQSIIQQQYSDVANVINSRDSLWSCDSSGIVPNVTGEPRGQSDCVLLGKLVRTEDGVNLTVNDVNGFINRSLLISIDDVSVFGPSGYNIKTSSSNSQSYRVDWGASISSVDDEDIDGEFSLLVLRSPASGNIKTFFNEVFIADDGITNLVDTDNIKDGVLCVNSKGLFGGKKSAIRINANTFNASGVEVVAGDEVGCN